MDFTKYESNIYTNSYYESKLALILCYGKKICNNIQLNIDKFLIEYSTGFTLFETDKKSRHPFDFILRILSKYKIKTSNKEFNELLKIIENTPNYLKINIYQYINFFSENRKKIYNELIKPANFLNLISLLSKYLKIKINIKSFCYTVNINKTEEIKNNEFINEYSINIPKNSDSNFNLINYLINTSQYQKFINSETYQKKCIVNTKDFLLIDLNREGFAHDWSIYFSFVFVDIPLILDLPSFVFLNQIKVKYELIAVITYDSTNKKYELFMKDKKIFYYYKDHQIYKINNEKFFIDEISTKSTHLFYKKIK